MKFMKLFSSGAVICLLAVFLLGPAQADNANDIILEFCSDTQRLIDDTLDDISRNADDALECFDDLDRCQNRADDAKDSVECVGRFSRCTERAMRDGEQACSHFLRGFRDAYADAARKARRKNVEDEVLDSPATQQCLGDSLDVVRLCAGLSD